MGGNGHDGAGAVSSQNVVGDKDGDLLAVDGIDAPDAVELHAGLFLVELGALQIALGGGGSLVFPDGFGIIELSALQPALDQRVLGRQDHVRCAEQGVRPGGEDHDLIAQGGAEGDLRAGGTADPVFLGSFYSFDIIDFVKVIDKALGIFGNFEHPLGFDFMNNFASSSAW